MPIAAEQRPAPVRASRPAKIDGPRRLRLLRRQAGDHRRLDRHPGEPGDRVHRPVGLRQVDLPAHAQPDERHHRRRAGRRARSGSTARTSTARRGRRAAARPGRHGVPEAQPVPEVDLRERRLRPAHPRPRPRAGRSSTRSSRTRCAAPGCGTRSRTACAKAAPRCRAASSSGCASRARSRRARGDPDGRALLGARSDRHRGDRGADRRAARPLRDRHRHPHDAAGGARSASGPPSSISASWSSTARPRTSSPIRARSGPRTTSPGRSADRRIARISHRLLAPQAIRPNDCLRDARRPPQARAPRQLSGKPPIASAIARNAQQEHPVLNSLIRLESASPLLRSRHAIGPRYGRRITVRVIYRVAARPAFGINGPVIPSNQKITGPDDAPHPSTEVVKASARGGCSCQRTPA